METANFCSLAANGKGKQKFVFIGRQTINSNEQLLFQQTCPSMPMCICIYIVHVSIMYVKYEYLYKMYM
jgi:hypothetical protein